MPTLIENRKARHDFEVLETLEAGIELTGSEVKSLRSGRGALPGSFVSVRGGEALLVGLEIPPYQPANLAGKLGEEEPKRSRRLLLTKPEIATLGNILSAKGKTVIPLCIYTKGKKIKVSVAVVRGKKQDDKREVIKKRDTDGELRRVGRGRGA